MHYLLCGSTGNAYKTNTNTIFRLQKKAIRIVNRTTFQEPTNPMFMKSKALEFRDLADFKTAQIMSKVKNKLLPESIQKLV